MLLKVIVLLLSVECLITANKCSNRTVKHGTVCVCSSAYCDSVPTLANLARGEYQLYFTSKDKPGFTSVTATFLSNPSSRLTIEIDVNTTYQTILGFGGAFTDSTGENILSLPKKAQDKLLKSYFGNDGIAYSVCRVPVGASDFSPRAYTHCDEEDPKLGKFALQYEDLKYKIPIIQKAQKLRKKSANGPFLLYASAWGAPKWMTTSNSSDAFLKPEYYQLWADYFIKFFDAYKKYNISFWGMTTQNEPIDGLFPKMVFKLMGMRSTPKWMIPLIQDALELRNKSTSSWKKTSNNSNGFVKPKKYQSWDKYYDKFINAYMEHNISLWGMMTQKEPDRLFPSWLFKLTLMGWTPKWMENWIGTNLGPTLKNSHYSNLKIIVHDDVRMLLPFVRPILENKTVLQYVDGVGVHWYTDFITPPEFLDLAKSSQKDLFLLSTEASEVGGKVLLGSWSRGVEYLKSILQHLEYDAVGWVDWNMVLDTIGGPTYIGNHLDSPVIVNAKAGEFYKQPMYYVLGHFSKFIIPGSRRLKTHLLNLKKNLPEIRVMAFLRPDNKIALIIYNSDSSNKTFKVKTAGATTGDTTVEPESLTTVLYAI